MVNPNRLLIVAVLGLALIACGLSLLEGESHEAAIIALMLAALAAALCGRGGLALYWLAMLVSWLFAAFLPILGLDLYLHANETPPYYDNGQPYDWTTGSLVLVIGLTGLGCHHCISQTHPAVNKNALDRDLNALNVGLISGILFGLFANLLLVGFFIEGVWTFIEIIWIYWFDSLLISAFGVWTVMSAERLDPHGTVYADKTPQAIRRLVLENAQRGTAVYYVIYFLLVTWILGLPNADHLGPLLLVAAALFASHHLESQQRRRGFSNRGLRMKGMKRADWWRHFTLNFGLVMALLAIASTEAEGAAVLFLLSKMIADIIISIVQYRYLRAVAQDSHPQLLVERRRNSSRRRYRAPPRR